MTTAFPQIPLNQTDLEIGRLFGARAWIVGGRVRDAFQAEFSGNHIVSKDNDYLVTDVSYAQAQEMLERAGWRVDLVGSSFAVIKATKNGETIDVAMPRREVSTGVGHKDFDVHAGPDVTIEEDLGRRDFPFNAMAYNVTTHEVRDPHNGLSDLRRGVLRMIGPHSFPDDALRMLRAVQFAARFDFVIAPQTRSAIADNLHLLGTVSPERVTAELDKLMLKAPKPSVGWELMEGLGMLPQVLPEIVPSVGQMQNQYHDLDVFRHLLRAADVAAATVRDGKAPDHVASPLIWSALFHDIGKPATAEFIQDYGFSFHGHEYVGAKMLRKLMPRMKFPREMVDLVSSAVEYHMYASHDVKGNIISDSAMRRQMRKWMEEQPLDLEDRITLQFLLRNADRMGKTNAKQPHENEPNAQYERRFWQIAMERPAMRVQDLDVAFEDVKNIFLKNGWEQAGFTPGKSISGTLYACLDFVTEDPTNNTRDALIAHAEEYAAQCYYVRDSQNAIGDIAAMPLLDSRRVGKETVHIGYSDGSTEVPEGGFIYVTRDNEIVWQTRSVMPRKIADAMFEAGFDLDEVAMTTLCVDKHLATMPPVERDFPVDNSTVALRYVKPLESEGSSTSLSIGDKRVERKGTVRNATPMLDDLIEGHSELKDTILEHMAETETFLSAARRQKRVLAKHPAMRSTDKSKSQSDVLSMVTTSSLNR